MGVIAELGRLAIAAWSPGGVGGGYIAAATYGSPETSFNAESRLELISVDIARSKLSVVSDVPSQEKFASVDWSIPARAHPAGLIGGGLTDGTVRVWDAASLIRGGKDDSIVFGRPSEQKKHAGPVSALAFNPFMPTRMSTGSADGSVLVWDLANPSAGATVKNLTAKPGNGNAPRDQITTVAWNRKVQHILASATSSGVMNVWDLKQSKQLMSIRNPRGRFGVSSITWHPDIATQIIITCDEDESTGALMWDLRNATAPIMTYTHHSPKGAVSSSWSTHDTDLLLTSSRDSRTIVMSVQSGEVVTEAPKSANWNFDVKWSPRIPGLYLSSSFDGRLNVNSIMTASTAPSVSSETANALAESFGEAAGGFQSGIQEQSPRAVETQRVNYNVARPPKWLKKPTAVSFAFGGLRSSVSTKDGKSGVTIESFSDSFGEVTGGTTELDSILMDLMSTDASPAQKWCEGAAKSAESPRDKMAWEVMAIMFQTDCRRKLLKYLGFELPPLDAGDEITMPVYGLMQSHALAVPKRPEPVAPEAVAENKTEIEDKVDQIGNGTRAMNLDGPAPWEVNDETVDDADMNDSLLDGDDTVDAGVSKSSEKPNGLGGKAAGTEKSFAGNSKDQMESIIKQAVIVGDFKTAVDACLHVGRAADALVIAHAGGPELWSYAQMGYVATASISPSSTIVGAIAGPRSKMDDYIRQCAESGKDSWKEALAVILTYTSAEELGEVCTALGQRLLLKEEYGGALVSFICGSNTKMATCTWMKERPSISNSTAVMMKDRAERLALLVQKVRLLTALTLLSQGEREIGAVRAMDEVSGSVLCEFGALLFAQGDVSLAVTYLSNLDPTYSCSYGTAQDLHLKASESLVMADAVTGTANVGNGGMSGSYTPYGNTYNQSYYNGTYGQGTQDYGAMPPPPQSVTSSWNSTPQVPPPPAAAPVPLPSVPQYDSAMASPPRYITPQAPAPTPAVTTSPPPPAGAYSATTQIAPAARPAYNPYATAPTFSQGSYPPMQPAQPPQQTAGSVASPPQTAHTAPPMQTLQPPAPMTPMAPPPYTTPSAPTTQPAYSMTPNIGVQTAALPPPPPPPSDDSAPPPMPYHARARPGQGAGLPPSSEIAVAETRRTKPISSSGTPGGPPRRSASTSSSLSALGIDSTALDKADSAKVPANQQIIVKSLRGSYTYAVERSQAPRYKRKIDDVNKRLGKLVAALNNQLLDQAVVDLLIEFAQAVEKANYHEASSVIQTLTKNHWDSNSQWIQGLKRLIDCIVTGR